MGCNERHHMNQMMIYMIIAIITFAFISIFFGGGITGDGMVGGGMMGDMMGFGWIFMLLPIIFIIFLIYALTDRNRPTYDQPAYQPDGPPPDQSTYEPPYRESGETMLVLEHRYASGEISREEYMRIRKDLERR